jgi:molybdate transport system ATP-binding protein
MSEPTPGLQADFEVSRGEFTLRLDLAVAPGRVTALLGPNGAGKSTALRVLAGLLPIDKGAVRLGGRDLEDTTRGLHVPPEGRRIGVVFQDYRLFPNQSARDNVAYGLRRRGMSRSAARARADEWLGYVGLLEHAGARPGRLSGGQAQRVALARALAIGPDLLLLDEPLAALDAATRMQVRGELRHHLAGFPGAVLMVTHDPVDAMVLASDVVVIENGAVVQRGPVAEVAAHPQTQYIARLVGLNLYRGLAGPDARVRISPDVELTTADQGDGAVYAAFGPAAVAVFRERPEGSFRNVFPARVADLEMHGSTFRLRLDGVLPALADVTAAAVTELDLVPGREVWFAVKANEISVYPA